MARSVKYVVALKPHGPQKFPKGIITAKQLVLLYHDVVVITRQKTANATVIRSHSYHIVVVHTPRTVHESRACRECQRSIGSGCSWCGDSTGQYQYASGAVCDYG